MQNQLNESINEENKQELEENWLNQSVNDTQHSDTVKQEQDNFKTEEGKLVVINEDNKSPSELSDEDNGELIQLEAYECGKCKESFVHANHLEQHMKEIHNLQSLDTGKYRKHLLIKICKEEMEVSEQYKCSFCNLSFETKKLSENHEAEHKPHICDRCGARFTRKNYLIDHAEVHSNDFKYKCEFCGKIFQRRTVLSKHRRIHTHPREHVCDLCGKRFNDLGTMKTHINLIHIKERKYLCTICMLTFPLKQTLEKHLKRHNKERKKEFVCNVCFAEYNDKSSLKRHYDVKHSKEFKKLVCEYCARNFTTRTNLYKHIRKFHLIEEQL